MMLGELNGSHLGFNATSRRWSRPGWREVTRHLGVRFDPTYDGRGPARPGRDPRHAGGAGATPPGRAGDVILSIDGQTVGPRTRVARVLTGDPRTSPCGSRSGAPTARSARSRCARRATAPPRAGSTTRGSSASARRSDRLSDGRLGYLHVRGMNWSSFERFEAELYKVGHGKDGLIIDVRDNGGGFTTDHLLTCLTQPRHAITVPRGGGPRLPAGPHGLRPLGQADRRALQPEQLQQRRDLRARHQDARTRPGGRRARRRAA